MEYVLILLFFIPFLFWWLSARDNLRQEISESKEKLLPIQEEIRSILSEVYRAKRCSRCGSSAYTLYDKGGNSIRIRCTGCNKMRWIEPHDINAFNNRFDSLISLLNRREEHVNQISTNESTLSGGYAQDYTAMSFDLAEPPLPVKLGKRRTIPAEVQRQVMDRDNGQCVLCGSGESLQYDHIIPFSKGGGNQPDNLRILCQSCNLSKGAGYS